MKVSIITVTYNSEAYLEQTIRSVLSQRYEDIEYIIVDGGSTDNTKNIISAYQNKISRFISEKDNGIYDALNKGLAMAGGDIIGILHSDDFFTHETVIKTVVQTFKDTQADAVYANLCYVDAENTSKIIRKWHSGSYVPNSFLYGWMPPHPTFFVKKSVYRQFGHFNLNFKTSADYELMLRFIHKHQIKLSYLNEYIVYMRVGGQSNASINYRILANLEDRKAWAVNDLKPYFFTLWLKPLRKIRQFFNRNAMFLPALFS
jgi:glycosyltransferase involved in cell wall biosynthesis